MTKKLSLKIITPERVVHESSVDQVMIPTIDGHITVLPDHVPLVSVLSTGDIVAKTGTEEHPFVVASGFVRITGKEVDILADFALPVEHIASEEAIAQAQARAHELQRQFANKEIVDFEHFESELERNLTTVRIGNKWKMKKYRG